MANLVCSGDGSQEHQNDQLEWGDDLKRHHPELGQVSQIANLLQTGQQQPDGADEAEYGHHKRNTLDVMAGSSGATEPFTQKDRA